MKGAYVYMLASKTGTIYIGVTNDLQRRVYEHKSKIISGFTSKYSVDQLIYYEEAFTMPDAIAREKQLKGWRRSKKLDLARTMNPRLEDLAADSSTSSE
jgi:putative endonuclease